MTAKSTIAQLLEENEEEILKTWMDNVRAEAGRTFELMTEAQIDEQCRAFLAEFTKSIGSENYEDITGPEYNKLLSMLGEISASRAEQGFMLTETVSFILGLKKAIKKHLQEYVEEPERHATEVVAIGGLIDKFSFYMFVSFLAKIEELAEARDISRLRYEERLKGLHMHASQLSRADSIQEVAEHTVDAMLTTLGLPMSGFFIVEGNHIHVLRIRGIPYPVPASLLPLDGKGVTVKAVNTKKTLRIPDVREEPAFIPPRIAGGWNSSEEEYLSELAVPVIADGKAVALLNVESHRLNAFSEQDQELLETLASHVASAISRLRHQEAYEASERRFRKLFENMGEGVFQSDLEGNYIMVNPAYARIYGYESLEEIIDGVKTWQTYISEEDREAVLEELREKGVVQGREMRFERRDGSIGWQEFSINVRRDKKGEIVGYEGTVRDISEKKQAEAEVRNFAYRLNSLKPGGCYLSESHERCLKAYADLTMHGVPGLCIVREEPRGLVENYGIKAEEIMLLSSKPLRGFQALPDLQSVSLAVSRLLKAGGGVVLLDGLEYLITRFGFEPVYSFIQEKRFDFIEADAVLLVPIDMEILTSRERALLSSEFIILE